METETTPVLQPGQRVELDITTVAFGGDGIGRVDNFVVFVPFVVEGERVEVGGQTPLRHG
jgi:predicted RNA-binding protein with TRAM domain